MKSYKLFYSWQSDKKSVRHLIWSALLKAQKKLEEEGILLVLDQDTRQRVGKRDIKVEVLNKIDNCDIFLADLTPIVTIPEDKEADKLPKHLPNSNVMFEYGYALRSKGERRMLVLAHFDKGEHIEYMPFDVNHDTISSFNEPKDLEKLAAWIKKIAEDVDVERSKFVPEYAAALYFGNLELETAITPQYKRIWYTPVCKSNIQQDDYNPPMSELVTNAITMQQAILKKVSAPIVTPVSFQVAKPIKKRTNLSYCPVTFVFFNKGTAPLQNCRITIKSCDDRVTFADSNLKEAYALPKLLDKSSTFVSETGVTQNISIINPSDSYTFDTIFIHAPHNIDQFQLEWSLSSMYFSCSDSLMVKVVPEYEYSSIENDSKQGTEEVTDFENIE